MIAKTRRALLRLLFIGPSLETHTLMSSHYCLETKALMILNTGTVLPDPISLETYQSLLIRTKPSFVLLLMKDKTE